VGNCPPERAPQMLKKSNQKGFTIIEVLIVLAIAGLIMLVVFLAVPALQRNQRNNARKAEASRISALVGECLSNKNGNTAQCDSPSELGFTETSGVGALPTTEYKELSKIKTYASSADAAKDQVTYAFNKQCSTTGDDFGPATSSRQYAVAYKFESGSAEVWSCING